MDIIDSVGFNGPIIITIITVYQLFKQIPYLISFCVFNFINIKLNEFLKICFREPRPEKIDLAQEQKKSIVYKLFYGNNNQTKVHSIVDPSHIYGMPSGHAQTGAFALGFLYFVQKSSPLFLLAAFIFLITLYQRWNTKKHTIFQLFIGTLTGILFSSFAYYGTKTYLYSSPFGKINMNDFIFKFKYLD